MNFDLIETRMEQDYPLPTACIGCHHCEKRCPQHLPISQHLKEIGRKLCWWEYDEEVFQAWIQEIPAEYTRYKTVLQEIRGHENHILIAMDEDKSRFCLRFMAFGREQHMRGQILSAETDAAIPQLVSEDGKSQEMLFLLEEDTTGGFAKEDCREILQKALAGEWNVC